MTVRTSIDVEKLLWWAYVRQCVLASEASGLDRRHGQSDGGLWGVRGRSRPHADAFAVHRAAQGHPLVIRHALSMSRPDWLPDLPVIEQPHPNVTIDNGERLDYARQVYADWWDGLEAVAGRLRSEPEALQLWAVTGPAAPFKPWFAPRVRQRVLVATDAEGLDRAECRAVKSARST